MEPSRNHRAFADFAAHVDSEPPELAWERLRSRWWSDRPIHQFSHREKIETILAHLRTGASLIDICRGASVDGVLGVLAAGRGHSVTIVSPSANHLSALQRFADECGIASSVIRWEQSTLDLFAQETTLSSDYVCALHILEHAYDLRAALSALRSIPSAEYVLAVPTCVNPAAMVRLGGSADPYTMHRGSIAAAVRGGRRIAAARLAGQIAVSETVSEYGVDTIHRWFFPRAFATELQWSNFEITKQIPDSIALPWFAGLAPLSRVLRRLLPATVARSIGFGTHWVLSAVP